MGFRGSPTAELILEDCEVAESVVLGQVGNGFIQAMQTLEYGRIGMATVCLGIAAKCLQHANKYSKERNAFGKPINRFQEISFKLADMMILSDVARLLIYQASWAKESKSPESAVLASVRRCGHRKPPRRYPAWRCRYLAVTATSRSFLWSVSTVMRSWVKSVRELRKYSVY